MYVYKCIPLFINVFSCFNDSASIRIIIIGERYTFRYVHRNEQVTATRRHNAEVGQQISIKSKWRKGAVGVYVDLVLLSSAIILLLRSEVAHWWPFRKAEGSGPISPNKVEVFSDQNDKISNCVRARRGLRGDDDNAPVCGRAIENYLRNDLCRVTFAKPHRISPE